MDRTAKAAETAERLAGAARSTAEAGKITGETDPNSPRYAPSGAYLALGAAGGDKTAQTVLTGETAQAGAVAGAKAQAEGQVTPKLRFEQAQANYRAELAKQNENQNSIGRAGLAVLEKQGTDYSTFAGQMANLKTQLAAAKTGDEVAAAFAPVATALGSNSFYGTHRLAPSEVEALGPHLGSLGRQLNTWFDKAGSGTLPAESVQEFSNLVDRLSDAKFNSYKQSTDYAVKLHGLDPAKTPVMDRDGSITTPATRAAAPVRGQRPAGATHTAKGSDGKLHWTDERGEKDYGVAE
jgi:hypothetical protein